MYGFQSDFCQTGKKELSFFPVFVFGNDFVTRGAKINKRRAVTMDPWIALVKDIGFPAVVTFYLLYRVEGKLDVLIQAVQSTADPQSSDREENV